MRGQRGSTITEFALAWPVILLLILIGVQVAVYGVETFACRSAALAGARIGSESGGGVAAAQAGALAAVTPSLVGASAAAWCPTLRGGTAPPRWVWVCAVDQPGAVRVVIRGTVPTVVPLPGATALPVSADAAVAKEVFQP